MKKAYGNKNRLKAAISRVWSFTRIFFGAVFVVACAHGRHDDPVVITHETNERYHIPNSLLSSTDDEFMPALDPGQTKIAYVVKTNGNLEIFSRSLRSNIVLRLTDHPADDVEPSFSPDGEWIAWNSQKDDVKGDIWIMRADGSEKKRLTDRKSADRSPVWSPNGHQLYFTSGPGDGRRDQIESVDVRNGARSVVLANAWDPAMAPNGNMLLFVRLDQTQPRLYVKNLGDGTVAAVTDGAYPEGLPQVVQTAEGVGVFFVRFTDDNTGDGIVDSDDAASLWRTFLQPGIFQGAPVPAATPLTAGENNEIFVAATTQVIAYTTMGLGDFDIYTLPLEGLTRPGFTASELLEASRAEENAALRRMLLRLVVAKAPELAAAARYELARDLAERGKISDALLEFEAASQLSDDRRLRVQCRVEVVRLTTYKALHNEWRTRSSEDKRVLKEAQEKLNVLAKELPDDVDIQQRVVVTRAELLRAQGEIQKASQSLESLHQVTIVSSEIGARAFLTIAEIYGQFDDLPTVQNAVGQLVARYPAERWYVERGAELLFAAVEQDSLRGPLETLESLARSNAQGPTVAARAQLRLASLQAELQPEIALKSIKDLLQNFPKEKKVRQEALFFAANLAEAQNRKDEALTFYEQILREFADQPTFRTRAKKAVTRIGLQSAQAHEQAGDLKKAADTYQRLLRNEPELALAHRRAIFIAARLGTIEKLIVTYEQAIGRNPEDAMSHYGLGYALTFYSPRNFDRAQHEVEESLTFNPRFAAARLTLGWILLQREFRGEGNGFLERALDNFETAAELLDPVNEKELWAAAQLNLGNALFRLGKSDTAFSAYLQRAWSGQPFDDLTTEVLFCESFARAAFHQNALDVALDMTSLGLKLSEKSKKRVRYLSLLSLRAAAFLSSQMYDEAAAAYGAALDSADKSETSRQRLPLLRGRALAEIGRGRVDVARELFEEILDLSERGYGEVEEKPGLFAVEDPADPRDVTRGIYGFARAHEKEIASAQLSRLSRSHDEYLHALDLSKRRIELLEKMGRDSRLGPRTRREYAYALCEHAALEVRSQNPDRAQGPWQQCLKLLVTAEDWASVATVLDNISRYWLMFPQLKKEPLLSDARDSALAGYPALSGDSDERHQLGQWLAREHIERAQQIVGSPNSATAELTQLINALDERLRELQAAKAYLEDSSDSALTESFKQYFDGTKENVTSPTDWRQAFEQALLSRAFDNDAYQTYLTAAIALYNDHTQRPLHYVGEQRAFFEAVVTHLKSKSDSNELWKFLERERLLRLTPSRHLWRTTRDWEKLDELYKLQTTATREDFEKALVNQTALTRALLGQPTVLSVFQQRLDKYEVFVQRFIVGKKTYWFVISQDANVLTEVGDNKPSVPPEITELLKNQNKTRVYFDPGEELSDAQISELAGQFGGNQEIVYALSATYLMAAKEMRTVSEPERIFLTSPTTLEGWNPQLPVVEELWFLNNQHAWQSSRQLAQQLLLRGISTIVVGGGNVPTEILTRLRSREVVPQVVQAWNTNHPEAPWLIFGSGGAPYQEKLNTAVSELLRHAKLAAQLFKAAREGKDSVLWTRAKTEFQELLRLNDYLLQPDQLAGLQKSTEKSHVKIAAALPKLSIDNRANLAQVHKALGEISEAVALQSQVLEQTKGAGSREDLLKAHVAYAATLVFAKKHDAAEQAYSQCVELAKAANQWKVAADCLVNRATEQRSLYRYEQAVQSYTQALDLYGGEKAFDRGKLITTQRFLGFLFENSLNNYARAADEYQQALVRARQEKDQEFEGRLLVDLARVWRQRGDYDKALEFVNQAAALIEEKRTKERCEVTLETAKLYWFRGNYRRAFDKQIVALELARRSRDAFLEIQALSLGGLIALNQGDLRRAEAAIGDALRLARSTGRETEEAAQLNNLGIVFREQGDFEQASASFDAALTIDRRLNSLEGQAFDLRNLGIVLLRQKEYDEARRVLNESLVLSRQVGNQFNELQSLYGLAQVEEDEGSAASTSYEQSLTLARNISVPEIEWRSLYGLGRLKQKSDKTSARTYFEQALHVAEKLGRSRAEEGGERSRADLYADLIRLVGEQSDAAAVYAYSERARVRAALDVLSAQTLTLGNSEGQQLLEQFSRSTDQSTGERERIRALLQSRYPKIYATFVLENQQPETLQRLLPEDTVVLSYFVGKDATTVSLLSKELHRYVRLEIDEAELRKIVDELRKKMRLFSDIEIEQRVLSKIIVDPIQQQIAAFKRLIVIPHGPLFHVPFATLLSDEKPLLETKILAIAPSIAVLRALYESPAKPLPKTRAAMAPERDLFFSLAEARSISNSPFLAEAATKEAFKNLRVDALDIAAHTRVDVEDPMATGLQFSGPSIENRLDVRDVFRLEEVPSLVALSSCESFGATRRGEEWLGLSYAFLNAGATTVVASQERVSDLASAVLMKRFFRYLKTMSPGEALRRAALTTKAYFPHPAHWGNFILLGDFR